MPFRCIAGLVFDIRTPNKIVTWVKYNYEYGSEYMITGRVRPYIGYQLVP